MVENHRCILIFVKITFLNFTFVLFHCSGIYILKFTISNNRVSVLKYLFCSVHKCRFSDSGCSFQYSDSTHQIQVTKFNTGGKKEGQEKTIEPGARCTLLYSLLWNPSPSQEHTPGSRFQQNTVKAISCVHEWSLQWECACLMATCGYYTLSHSGGSHLGSLTENSLDSSLVHYWADNLTWVKFTQSVPH